MQGLFYARRILEVVCPGIEKIFVKWVDLLLCSANSFFHDIGRETCFLKKGACHLTCMIYVDFENSLRKYFWKQKVFVSEQTILLYVNNYLQFLWKDKYMVTFFNYIHHTFGSFKNGKNKKYAWLLIHNISFAFKPQILGDSWYADFPLVKTRTDNSKKLKSQAYTGNHKSENIWSTWSVASKIWRLTWFLTRLDEMLTQRRRIMIQSEKFPPLLSHFDMPSESSYINHSPRKLIEY